MFDDHLKNNLESFRNLPTKKQINNEIRLFCKHNRVVFCTMGKSAFACRKLVYTARSYGLDWYDLDVCHAFHGDAGIIKKGDLLVFVSKSGETKETLDVAKYFHGWETISIISDDNSSLARICKNNIYIPIEREGSPFGYAPMISTTMYMIVLHGILCEVVNEAKCTIEDYARNHPNGKIGKLLVDAGII